MKFIIFLCMSALSFNVLSGSINTSIERLSAYNGQSISVSAQNTNGEKSVYLYARGKHGIRAVLISLNLQQSKRLRLILLKAENN